MIAMRRRSFLSLLAAGSLAGCARFEPPHVQVERYEGRKVRVACVGDSITFGAGVEDRESNNYPAVLGGMLGNSFEVRNFGRSGATLLSSGDLPYVSTEEYKAAVAWIPDVVILKLGTNDTKPQNWKGPDAFNRDFNAMLDLFLGLKNTPKPKVWVCLPVPVFESRWGINSETLETGVIPVIMGVCQKRKIPVIDLNDALTAHPEMFPDKIHPNAAGAKLMALTVFQAIRP
jgi:acyl-CoA thioesterase-1